jgi:hypothetical protein
VAAHAAVRATPEALAQWRRQPPPISGQPLPASLLKHSEDQTVAAVAALHDAICQQDWSGSSFADWAVLAASNFFGRGGTAHTIQRFSQEGAWGVSPHIIPHQSLHAVSGTLSQLLKIHGPNFGICGGAHACHDAFLIAATVLAEGQVPGVWMLLTGHEREWIPVESPRSVEPARPPLCEAVALALLPEVEGHEGLHVRVAADLTRTGLRDLTLTGLVAALATLDEMVVEAWRLPGVGWMELEVVRSAVGSRR